MFGRPSRERDAAWVYRPVMDVNTKSQYYIADEDCPYSHAVMCREQNCGKCASCGWGPNKEQIRRYRILKWRMNRMLNP